MSPHEVHTQLAALARAHLGGRSLPAGPLDSELDSLQRLTLVVAIEDHFEICFAPEEDEQVRTVDDVVQVVLRHLGAADG